MNSSSNAPLCRRKLWKTQQKQNTWKPTVSEWEQPDKHCVTERASATLKNCWAAGLGLRCWSGGGFCYMTGRGEGRPSWKHRKDDVVNWQPKSRFLESLLVLSSYIQGGKGCKWQCGREALERLQEKSLHQNPFMKISVYAGNILVSLLLNLAVVSFQLSPHGQKLKVQRPK